MLNESLGRLISSGRREFLKGVEWISLFYVHLPLSLSWFSQGCCWRRSNSPASLVLEPPSSSSSSSRSDALDKGRQFKQLRCARCACWSPVFTIQLFLPRTPYVRSSFSLSFTFAGVSPAPLKRQLSPSVLVSVESAVEPATAYPFPPKKVGIFVSAFAQLFLISWLLFARCYHTLSYSYVFILSFHFHE